MAFCQLLIAGMALATRLEESRQVRVVEKEVLKTVVVREPAVAQVPAESGVVSRPPLPTVPPVTPSATVESPVTPSPVVIPEVADPRSERLVKEARQARVAGDMGKAIMKLEEALASSPEDPTVHYELGLTHEQMGVNDIAAAHYEKVFQMGVTEAGSLYQLAANKLRDGFGQPDAMLGKLSLGRVRIFNNPNYEGGQRVILTIPVQKAPATEVNVGDIAVEVFFFNRTSKGDIIQLEDNSGVTQQWMRVPLDWAGGEEDLRMTYTIPDQDKQTEHLFGGRTYYGQVVSLTYKGEVMDVQAWPRDLAARISKPPSTGSAGSRQPEFQDNMPPDFDPTLPLLPTK